VLVALGLACMVAAPATGCAEQEADGLGASYPVGSSPPPREPPGEAIDELTPPPADAPPLPPGDAPPTSAGPGTPPPPPGADPAQGASVVIGDNDPAQGGDQASGGPEDGAPPPVDQVPPSMQGVPADAPPDGPPDTDPSALNAFHGALDPYGSWVDDPTYGTVWVPSPGAVGPDFTPYETAGRWAYDDSNYTWVSDYSWGWAPFHYGRWVYSRPIGWGWIPGRTYAGAWVSWRYGWDDWAYVGWAPLAPTWGWRRGVAVGLGFVPAAPYAFVSTRDLFAARVASRVITGAREVTVAAHTRPYATGTTAAGRTIAHPTVGGPSPSTLGIPQSAVVRTASYQAAAAGRRSAPFGQAGAGGANQARSLAPAYGAPAPSHFGGRFGAGFTGTGIYTGPTRTPAGGGRTFYGPSRSYTLGGGGAGAPGAASPYYRGTGGASGGAAYYGPRSLSTGGSPGASQGGGAAGAPPAVRGGIQSTGGAIGGGFRSGGGGAGIHSGGGRSSGGRGGHR
jgi:hypothetical protein